MVAILFSALLDALLYNSTYPEKLFCHDSYSYIHDIVQGGDICDTVTMKYSYHPVLGTQL